MRRRFHFGTDGYGCPLPRVAVLTALGLAAVAALADAPAITNAPASQTLFLGDPAVFRVGASGTPPLSFQWFRDDAPLSGATAAELAFTTVAADDRARFTVQVSNTVGVVTSPPAVLTIDLGMAGPTQTARLVELTNVWRYSVGKTNPGPAWPLPGFADGAWPGGGGLLYVEDASLPAPKTTALPLNAGSLPTTCYFRTPFTNVLANPYAIRLVANTLVDDGVTFYLNGAEAYRLGMPTGEVTYATAANRSVGNAAYEGPFDFPTTNLVTGTNILAAEVHQYNAGSSDVVLGLTLDAVWQPRLRDTAPPVVAAAIPPAGAAVASLAQIEVQFSEEVQGVDAGDLLINGVAATQVIAVTPGDYIFRFPPPATGAVSVTWAPAHGIADRSANANPFAGAGFGYVLGPVLAGTRLPFLRVTQSTDADAAHAAARAVDGATATFSLTADLPGSWWQAELGRPFPLERIELVNRPAPDDGEMGGLTLHVLNMDDQVVYGTNLANPGSGGVALISLPAGTLARSLWIGLPGTETNHAGNHRVGLAEVRLFGVPNLPYGPAPVGTATNTARVWQSSEYGGFPAENAVDGNPDTFTHTADVADSFWMADLGRAYPVTRVEIVNRSGCCDNRLTGLVLRLFDGASNTVASASLPNPGLGGTWTYEPAAGTAGRWIRVGLEGGQTNGGGNHYVTLAEARVFSGVTNLLVAGPGAPVPVTNNLASFKPCSMLRLDNSVPPATQANDDNYATETKTTLRTVDGYWEVDLGAAYALYGVRVIAASGIGGRLTNAVVRLYDGAHDSVFAQRLAGTPDTFDLDLNGPRFARYVRVGLEDKQRTDPAGGIEFYIGFREVEVFGRPTNHVGILAFTASASQVPAGDDVTLSWAVDDVRRVEIHPALGSVGAYTATNGVGSVTLKLTRSTEFVLVASNAAGLFTRAVSVQAGAAPLPVQLSEVVAENKYSLADGYGEASDWIELRNPGNTPVELTGWGLSDDPARPMKWTFPTTTLAPHGTLIVFASGRDTPTDPAGHLHASFRLDKDGGALVLTANPGATVADSVTYPELDTDLAYGRDLEGRWTFLDPTPSAVNAAPAYQGWVKPPGWSHARGFYETGFTLSLTNPSPGATLRYSLDGSEPTLAYAQGLPITGTVAVRAQAVRPGHKPSRVQTKTFLFVNDVVTSPVMNAAITQNPSYAPRMKPGLLALPSISICVPGQPEYEEREGSLEILWPNGGDPVQVNCGISRFGNAWTKYAKRSLRMKCRARYGDARLHAPLFDGFDRGVLAQTSFDELDFRSGSQDMYERGFYMAGRFVEDTMLDMGSLNPHGRFVHLYLNGVYWGQYDCRELLVEPFLADYLGGTKDDYVAVRGNDNVGDDFVLGAPEPPNIEPWERVLSLKNSYAAVRPYLDVPHLIDFLLLWNYGDAESEYRAGGPLAAGSGFKFWIADADGFLRTSALGQNRTGRSGPGDTFRGLLTENHPDFKALLADHIYRHFFNNGALTPAANDARLTARMAEVRDSLLAECARWGYRTPASWESSATTIRSSLFPGRTAQLLGYLRSAGWYPAFDPPTFNRYGGLVTNGFLPQLTSASGTIYYTLDASDPRLPGGGLSPAARAWSPGAVTITNDLTLNVRVRNAGGQWSARAQPQFLLASRRAPAARDLLITEINYDPAGPGECEFVELWNASTNLLELAGLSLSNAVRFVFPAGFALAPGAFVIVAEDPAAFAARYQNPESLWYHAGLIVVGPWSGALNNAGETVALVAADGTVLSTVPYEPGGDWPERAGGQGSTIELRRLPLPNATDAEVRSLAADGRQWSASSLYHGSPGRFDAFVRTLQINEVSPATTDSQDWVELLNTGEQPADLADCTLTDNLDLPARWAFPAGTKLDPGQFLVLNAAQLGFAFSDRGDNVALLQMRGSQVLRFLDTVDFRDARADESFGTFPRSDGALDFTELRAPTPGAPNALPRVGPVVVSEIMFAPPPGKAAYLELANVTSEAVPLFDPAHPTSVWTLEGLGNFAFPANTILPPCSTLLLCATDPDAFRAQYGLGPAVPVLGPWPGVLAADGENLTLLQPGPPEADGGVPFYRVDHLSYRTNAPWPAVATGASLERMPIEAYGNDPAGWRAGPLNGTPGTLPANRLPVLHAEGPLSVTEETPMTITISVADPDAPWQTGTLWPTRIPPGSTFDELTGTLTWTPTEAEGPGMYHLEFAATDHAGCRPGFAFLPLTLDVHEANRPPAWLPQADLWLPTGLPWTIPLAVADPDVPAQRLRLDVAGLPPGFAFDPGARQIVGTGLAPGDYPVAATASDGQQPPLDATLYFVIHLTERFALTARVDTGGRWLTFPAIVGETYRVEACDDLAAGDWQLLAAIPQASDPRIAVLDPATPGSPQRFYRVRWLR